MVTFASFRKLALSLKDATEEPHFERVSFRVNRKIFATYDKKNHRACLMLSPEQQDLFCLYDKTVVYPVPNKWGLKGATYAELKKVKQEMLAEAVKSAYDHITGKKKN